MRTGIDFRVLTEYAPTAEQQRLRKLEEDKLNLGVMIRNVDTDKATSQQDIYILRNTTSEFHNITVYLEPTKDYIEGMGEEDIEALKQGGEIIRIPMTIGEFLSGLNNIELDVSPRLEGALDTSTFVEIEQMKDNIAMIPQGTPAYSKALVEYLKKVAPEFKIREQDLMMPQAPETPQAPQANMV
jgi:hypothetical protein